MLRTSATAYQGTVLAVILTGMGQDGLAGARQVALDGGTVLAQDEETSVVWRMPGAVARVGLCQAVLPIEGLAARIVQLAGRAT
jgi:two-component system chemotaxis response regulator CheB